MTDSTHDQWVRLARIRRTQGRKGEVFADILTDFPEKFSDRRRLWLLIDPAHKSAAARPAPAAHETANPPASGSAPPREAELIHHWLHKGGIVLHFGGVDSISAAETLIGFFVAVPLAERAPLPAGETYISDLVGCTLLDVSGPAPITVGVIHDVDRTAGPTPLLVVLGAKGEILIPFAESFLRNLDLGTRRIEMALPEGLLDLNA